MLREIALWWRCFQISAECRYTTRLLQRLECFHETVAAYFETRPTPAFIEHLGRDFLDRLSAHEDPLVRAVAQTERHIGQLRFGEIPFVEVIWDRNPDSVFAALDKHDPLPRKDPEFSYQLQIGNGIDCVAVAH